MTVPVVAVVGSTAAGKTDLSLDLAQRLVGEVINTDAMQVYRGMDIGTAKLPVGQRRGIAHHLLDTLSVQDPATVAAFQGWARTMIDDLLSRDRSPVLVGGSALYTRAVLDRFEFPRTDAGVRASLEHELARLGSGAMHQRLRSLDADAADRIIAGNARRVVRALEVIAITGRPYSASLPRLVYHYPHTHQIGIRIDRPTLDARIGQRVDRMFTDGFVDEVDRLLREGLADGRTASRAIGYRQVTAHLRGELTLADAIEQTKAATRRFARRQDGWFTKDPRIHWVDFDDPDRVDKALAAVRTGLDI